MTYVLDEILIRLYPDKKRTANRNTTYETIDWMDIPENDRPSLDALIAPLRKLREERNVLLDNSDKYMTTDYPHRLELDIQNWKDYRRALRDLPTTARPTLDEDGNLTGVEWPTLDDIKIEKTLPPAREKDLQTTRTDLQTTRTDLQTTRTQLEEELQTTRTQLEVTTLKLLNTEARLGMIEQTMTSILSKLNV